MHRGKSKYIRDKKINIETARQGLESGMQEKKQTQKLDKCKETKSFVADQRCTEPLSFSSGTLY